MRKPFFGCATSILMTIQVPAEFGNPRRTKNQPQPSQSTRSTAKVGRLFGIRMGDFGLFASLLLSFALGFAAFFATTFVSIVAILIYNSAGHHTVDFANAYKLIALPVGLLVLVVSLIVLGFFWIRRKVRGS